MQRFYFPHILPTEFVISSRAQSDLYHQMTRVLRMQRGDRCIFFTGVPNSNGLFEDCVFQIKAIDKTSVTLIQQEILIG